MKLSSLEPIGANNLGRGKDEERKVATAAATFRSPKNSKQSSGIKDIFATLPTPVASPHQSLNLKTSVFDSSKTQVTKTYQKLFETLKREFTTVLSSYRKFDRFRKGQVNFQEFAYTVEELQLRLDREKVQMLF